MALNERGNKFFSSAFSEIENKKSGITLSDVLNEIEKAKEVLDKLCKVKSNNAIVCAKDLVDAVIIQLKTNLLPSANGPKESVGNPIQHENDNNKLAPSVLRF